MKKHILSKLLLLSALLGGANSVWAVDEVVGNIYNLTDFWGAHSTQKVLSDGQKATFTFVNYTDQTDKRNNFIACVSNDAERNGDGYVEHIVYCADNYDLISMSNGTSSSVIDSNFPRRMNNSNVVVTFTYQRNTVTVQANIHTGQDNLDWTETFTKTGVTGDIRTWLSLKKAHLVISSIVVENLDPIEPTPYTVDGIVGGYTQKSTIGQSNKKGGFFDNAGNSFVIKKGQTYKLNFKNSGTSSEIWYNWIVKFVHGGAEYFARSDWYAVNGDNWKVEVGTFTDRYKATTDGGKTTSGVNWETFKSVMSDIADVDLTITYTSGGDFKIQGTSANGDNIFYYDYSLGGFTNDITVTLGCELAYLTDVVVSSVANTGANGITTFSSSYHLNLDGIAGATAYSVLETDASSAKLTTATGNVAAGEGLFLKGDANTEVTIPLSSAGSAISGNMLVGSPVASTIDNLIIDYKNIYVLGATDGKLHNVATYVSSNTLTIPACKAFLRYSGDSNARDLSLIFDDAETTGIQAVEKKLSDNALYFDLMGRRVAQPQKGLYIVNGKKVVIK